MVTAFIQVCLVFKSNKPFMTYILLYFLTAVILKRLKKFCPFANLIENLCQTQCAKFLLYWFKRLITFAVSHGKSFSLSISKRIRLTLLTQKLLALKLASAILGANETGRKTKSLLFAAITELRHHKTVSQVSFQRELSWC